MKCGLLMSDDFWIQISTEQRKKRLEKITEIYFNSSSWKQENP